MPQCLICQNAIEPFMSFGKMPIANGFLRPEDFGGEFVFDLKVGCCERCHMVQLTELVDPAKLFHENYAYFSSISTRMAEHFRCYAQAVRDEYLKTPDPLVVEIGSNDGIMLQHFAKAGGGTRHVGIEPSANVAEAARKKGVNTLCRFFNEETAKGVRTEYGPADAVLGANVVCHLPNIHSVLKGLEILLGPKGLFIFEEPYLGDIIEKTSYDQIYDEHYFYFCLHSLANLFKQYGMEIVNIMPQNTHGGSMRYVVARCGTWPVQPVVGERCAKEVTLGLMEPASFGRFRRNVERSRDQLLSLLEGLRRRGKRITAYGATSKSTTVTNYCGIGPELIEFISDTTPGKQRRFSPGAHIPVVPYERFKEAYPDYALLFAWNHGEEIVARETAFTATGGRFISYVPNVRVQA